MVANSCRVTTANYKRMILVSVRPISQLFTIGCHFNHFFDSCSRRGCRRHTSTRVKASGTKQRPRVLVVAWETSSRGYHLNWNQRTMGSGDYSTYFSPSSQFAYLWWSTGWMTPEPFTLKQRMESIAAALDSDIKFDVSPTVLYLGHFKPSRWFYHRLLLVLHIRHIKSTEKIQCQCFHCG